MGSVLLHISIFHIFPDSAGGKKEEKKKRLRKRGRTYLGNKEKSLRAFCISSVCHFSSTVLSNPSANQILQSGHGTHHTAGGVTNDQ